MHLLVKRNFDIKMRGTTIKKNVTWYLKLVSVDFVYHAKFDYMKICSVLEMVYISPWCWEDMKKFLLCWASLDRSTHGVAQGKGKHVYARFGQKSEGKRPPGKRGLRWQHDIKIYVKEISFEGVNWIHLHQNEDHWWLLWECGNESSDSLKHW